METNESTPLRVSEPDRSYVYMSARNRVYRSKVRQFQCCVCAGLLGAFVLAMIITVSYMVNHDVDDDVPSDEVNATETPATPLQQLSTLLRSTGVLQDAEKLKIPVSGYNSQELLAAFQKAEVDFGQRMFDEGSHPAVPLPPSHPSSLHQKVMFSTKTAQRASQTGQIILAATKNVYKDKWQSGWVGRGPRLLPSKWVSREWCPEEETLGSKCWTSSPYRTIDGTCNNLVNPEFGVAMKPFRRLMAPDYGDGISSPRRAKDGSELPSAREVSISVHRPVYANDPEFTVVLAVWGQFVDHDFTATALSHRSDGQAITCCNTVWQHPECFPVPLAPGDPFYHQFNITCMDFVRSAPAPTCSLGPREQLNQVTPFIDGSVVYGADMELMSELRTFTDGLLVSSRSVDGRELLPVDRKLKDGCNQAEEAAKGRYCFKSGDARANENLHLTTLHLILARQHNKVAAILKAKHPTWSDEMLFQESRKIVAAQMQHIHYNEFLPIVLGRHLADELELTSQKSGYYHGYNSSVNPQIGNEFAANAFRFGHTLMQGLMKMIANDKSSEEYVQLHKMLFNPFGLYESGYIEKAVRGATQTLMSKPGNSMSPELQGNLFKSKSGPCGLDLVSLNIQRGRDHGLPAYPVWREYCGGNKPTTFEDLSPIMDADTITRLKAMYKSVDDIDPYTGLVSETPVTTSGILGPTATCVIAEQFLRLKKGDRFWYETPQAPQAFTLAQLDEIRKTTLSTLLCDNTDELESVQPYSMAAVSASNPITPCADISRPNWDAWDSKPSIHLVQASSISVRNFKTAEEQDKSLRDPTNPIERIPQKGELVIGATAVAGSVTGGFEGSGTDEVLWDGTLPLTIPSNLINQVFPSSGNPMTPLSPDLIDHKAGILWTGTIDLIGTNRLELNADYFSVPIFVSGNGFTQKWWNGKATIQLNVNWNTSELVGQAAGSFFTPIALRSKKNSGDGVGAVPILSTGEAASLRFPILLQGAFSADHSQFFWNGNMTIIYPKPRKPILTMSFEPSYLKKPPSRLVIGATANGGSISGAYDGGTAQNLWDGSFPVSIPSPFLDHKLPAGTVLPQPDPSKPLEHRGGAFWNGKLDIKANDDLVLSGDFSLPIFLHAMGVTAQKWWTGTFGITLSVNWNTTSIHDLPTGKYFSPLAFRKVKKFGPSHPYTFLTTTNPNDLDSTAPAPIPSFPIILQGDYNADHSEFLWNGNVTLVFPKESSTSPPPPAGYQLLSATASSKSASKPLIFGGNATSVTYSTAGNEITWDGTEPLQFTIPQKVSGQIPILDIFHGGSSVFTGSINISAAKKISLKGKFSVPISNYSNPGAMIWQGGNIEADLDVTWNSSLPNTLSVENETLQCMLFLKPSRTLLKSKEPTSIMQKLMATGKKGPSILPQCLITLSGSSPDNATFIWSGSYFAIILSPIVAPTSVDTSRAKRHVPAISSNVPHRRTARSLPSSVGHKMVLGGEVTGGKITASSNGGPEKSLFQGSFPVAIPMPAFDRYLPRTTNEYMYTETGPIFHGNGPIWSGSVSYRSGTKTLDVTGDFKFPLYIHGDTFTQEWWTGHADLVINVDWNSTKLDFAPTASLPNADFYSPIRFKTDKMKKNVDAYNTVQKDDSDFMDTSPLAAPNEPNYPKGPMPKFPVILLGAMNEGKTAFMWNGKVTLVFPYSTPQSPAASIPSPMADLSSPGAQLGLSHGIPVQAVPSAIIGHKMVLGGRVIEGAVSAASGGAPKRTLFHGSLPVSIPMPAFDRYLPKTSEEYVHTNTGPIFHGNGPIWAGSVSYRPGTKIIELYGEFRVPLYLHGNSFTQEWWFGHAQMVIEVAWNSTNLDLAPIASLPNADFYSPIRFRYDDSGNAGAYSYDNAQKIDSDMMNTSPMVPPSEPFYPKGPMPKFPIILHGAMNADRSAFLWYGNLTLVFPYAA